MNWYLQSSENSDVIRSSRIRFVRNINGINFKLGLKDREILENKLLGRRIKLFIFHHLPILLLYFYIYDQLFPQFFYIPLSLWK